LVKFVQKNTNTTFVKVGSKKTLHSLFGKVCLKKTLLQITFGKGWFKKNTLQNHICKSWFKKTTLSYTSYLVKVGSKNSHITLVKVGSKKHLLLSHLVKVGSKKHLTHHIC
jgi:hypothetical protein